MQKLICRPNQWATIVRPLPMWIGNNWQWTLGRIVQVRFLLHPNDRLIMRKNFPAWKIANPMFSPDGVLYDAVYDACLAPLPDGQDVKDFDEKEILAGILEEAGKLNW